VTLGAKSTIRNVILHASLDFQNARDETANTQLPRRAKQHGTLGADYNFGRGSAGAEFVFSGPRFDDTDNLVRMGGYGIFNLHANYSLSKDWSLLGNWNNVFNKDYELAHGYNTPGSSVFVGIRYGIR
jgi:vitamin B12 transporter